MSCTQASDRRPTERELSRLERLNDLSKATHVQLIQGLESAEPYPEVGGVYRAGAGRALRLRAHLKVQGRSRRLETAKAH